MDLGAFSISLAVKDLDASRAFYEKFGFEAVGGEPEKKWVILRNKTSTIGLFQGFFEKNILTFNPGFDAAGDHLEDYTDVRELQAMLKEQGVTMAAEADESAIGPGSFIVIDPDGNPVLVDQHR